MYANTIVFSCFLFATFKYCTSTNIFSYLDSKFASAAYIAVKTREGVENIYIRSLTPGIPRDDPVCALTAARKKALCELIFQIEHYRYSGIYLGKVALHLAELPCEEKLLSFKHRSDFLGGKTFKTKMYPCHGRHEPVRTSFVEDNYYDKYYVAGGPDANSVTIYVHEYDITSDRYIVYDYVHNVNVSALRDMFITAKEVTAELRLNKTIISTFGQEELENIFIREQDYYTNTDPICDLEYERKISLCKIVFSNLVYKQTFRITLNKAAVYLLDMQCEKKPVSIINVPKSYLKSRRFEQNLYPCYARKHVATEHILTDEYLKQFYVSRGPRNNSVFVYMRMKITGHREQFRLFALLENVYTRALKPTEITDEELVEESPTTYSKVREIVEEQGKHAGVTGLFRRSGTGSIIEEIEREFHEMIESIRTHEKKAELKKPEKLEDAESLRKQLQLDNMLNYMAADKTRIGSESKIKSAFADLTSSQEQEEGFPKRENLLDTLDHMQIGPQVIEKLVKKRRETELISKTYSGASVSSQRLKKKLEQRKLMEKGKPTSKKEKFIEEEVKKLIAEMGKSFSMKGTEGNIPGGNGDDLKESDEKDNVGDKKKKTRKK